MTTDEFKWMLGTDEELEKCPKCDGPVENDILKISFKKNDITCFTENWGCRKCETIWLMGKIEIDR